MGVHPIASVGVVTDEPDVIPDVADSIKATFPQPEGSWTNLQFPNLTLTMEHYIPPGALASIFFLYYAQH